MKSGERVAFEAGAVVGHHDHGRDLAGVGVGEVFNEDLCRDYARELSVAALQRGHVFFKALAEEGRINSVTLAKRLQFTSSKALAGALTNQLKKAARTLGVEVPWEETEDGDGRTVWLDRDGIAEPLAEAILAEVGRRTGS